MVNSIKALLRSSAFIIVVLSIVELLMMLFGLSPAAFARPSEILLSLPSFIVSSKMLPDVLGTLIRTIIAFIVCVPIGIIVGILAVKSKYFDNEFFFAVDFFRSIPATALIPLFLVVFGPQDMSKIAVGIFSGSLSVAISVIVGQKSLNPDRALVANLLEIKGFKRIALYELPEIAPIIFVGARTAASLCLILVVVGEMFIGSKNGLGKVIMDMRYSDNVPTLYAAIVVTGIIGYVINVLLVGLENRMRAYL